MRHRSSITFLVIATIERTSEVKSRLVVTSLATAVLCTIWMLLGPAVGLIGWAGFAGCTSYFAYPKSGPKALPLILCCVLCGSAFAFISLFVGGLFLDPRVSQAVSLVMTCVTTYFMCADAHFKYLSYVPGTFFGSFSTFAAGGNPMIIPSLVIGVLLGLACDMCGQKLADSICK